MNNLRQYKIFGLAAFDLILAILGMLVIFLIAKRVHFPKLPVWPFVAAAVLLTLPVAITFHILFGVNTALNYKLGLSGKPQN